MPFYFQVSALHWFNFSFLFAKSRQILAKKYIPSFDKVANPTLAEIYVHGFQMRISQGDDDDDTINDIMMKQYDDDTTMA